MFKSEHITEILDHPRRLLADLHLVTIFREDRICHFDIIEINYIISCKYELRVLQLNG